MRLTQTKYKNRKVLVDGIKFDSEKEARRYRELKLLEDAGEITDLRRQVRYELIPAQRIDGKLVERKVDYVADFCYIRVKDQKLVVEDVKGYRDGGAYRVFVIKRKLMLSVWEIKIDEI